MREYYEKGKELLRRRGKRYLSLLLSVVLMLSLIPVMRTDADAAVTIKTNSNGECLYTDPSTGNVYKVSSDKDALALLQKDVKQYLKAGYTMDLVSTGSSTTGGGTTSGISISKPGRQGSLLVGLYSSSVVPISVSFMPHILPNGGPESKDPNH